MSLIQKKNWSMNIKGQCQGKRNLILPINLCLEKINLIPAILFPQDQCQENNNLILVTFSLVSQIIVLLGMIKCTINMIILMKKISKRSKLMKICHLHPSATKIGKIMCKINIWKESSTKKCALCLFWLQLFSPFLDFSLENASENARRTRENKWDNLLWDW